MTTTYENPVSVIDHDGLPQALPVITANTIKEGDLVHWDATNFTARACTEVKDVEVAGGTHGTKGLIGVAVGSNKPEIYGGEGALPSVPVISKATVFLQTTAGEKYKPFDAVKLGADAQTISNAGGPSAAQTVGYVILDPPAEARPEQATPVPEEVEGATGLRIRILLSPKFVPATVI